MRKPKSATSWIYSETGGKLRNVQKSANRHFKYAFFSKTKKVYPSEKKKSDQSIKNLNVHSK